MATIKAVDADALDAGLKLIGDSIREKTGNPGAKFKSAQEMADAVGGH